MSQIPLAAHTEPRFDAWGGVFPTGEPRWRTWMRPMVVVLIAAILVGLGVANIVMRARWHEVEDGVLWGARTQGVTAVEVAPESPAALAGIRAGDILLAVNGAPVESPADVVEYQHRSSAGTRLGYSVLRLRD